MHRRPGGSLAEPLAWLAIAGVTFALTYQFDEPLPTYAFGPAGGPRALLVGIFIAALALLLFPDPVATGGTSETYPDGSPPPGTDRNAKLRRLGIFVVPLVYVFMMDRVGFLLVTPFFLAAYMYLLGFRRWLPLACVTLAIYGLIVAIFVKLLFTPLPQGVGFFHSLNGWYISLIR
ncbi:MAG: tripartite tricarboxylate transporter TctB family protein [Nitrospinota bacterium]